MPSLPGCDGIEARTACKRYWPNVQYSVNSTYRSHRMCNHRPRIAWLL